MEVEFYDYKTGQEIWSTVLDSFHPIPGDTVCLMIWPNDVENYRVMSREFQIMQGEDWNEPVLSMQVNVKRK